MDTLSDLLEQGYGLGRNPVYEYSRCRWSGTGGTECHACVQACPEGVFPDVKAKKPDYDKCSKCGLCAAACPTRAIAAPQIRVRQFLRALASDEAMSVGCLHDESHFTLRLDCLAALSWEEIACAALKNGVVLSLRACPTCPKRDHYARLMDSLEQVRRFLGDDFFFDRVQLLEEGDEAAAVRAALRRYQDYILPQVATTNSSELGYLMILAGTLMHTQEFAASGEALATAVAAQLEARIAANPYGILPAEHFEAPAGPNLADLIYTINFAFVGLALAARKNARYRPTAEKLGAFLAAVQDDGEEYPALKGCWRGMYDCQAHRYGGGNLYEGGANSIYSGWTNAPIAIGMLLMM